MEKIYRILIHGEIAYLLPLYTGILFDRKNPERNRGGCGVIVTTLLPPVIF